MTNNFCTVMLIALLLAGCSELKKNKVETVNRFNWLNGSWTMKADGGIITEQWEAVNDSLMIGSSDFIQRDSVIPFETIRIFRRDTMYFYEAKAAGQNKEQPVEFKFTFHAENIFVAENPVHDFPKRITYHLVNKDSIHAWVDGGSSKPDKKFDYYYSRVKK